MAQLFPVWANTLAKVSVAGGMLLVLLLTAVGTAVDHSPYVTEQEVVRPQPVPFSHEHHVGGLGIDCRYCHTTVTESKFAGFPSTKTCMTCHSQIWRNSQLLEPVRSSWATNTPIQWTRVHNLPQFVYFDHSIHVNKGVGCQTCHGKVNEMPIMYQASSLQMRWCLECHRHPEQFVNVPPDKRDEVFDMNYQPDVPQSQLGPELVRKYVIHTEQMTNCSVCHR